jgi:serine/threonine protein phosphatase PrpC
MSQVKSYIEQLFKKHNIEVAKRHFFLLEDFIKDNSVVEAFSTIQKKQASMVDLWNEKIRIDDIRTKQLILPNGTVGRPYEFVFDFFKLGINGIGDYNLAIEEKVGISFNKNENKITGVLKEAGEHKILMNFKLLNADDKKPYHQKEIKLIVNPDPKSLWRPLPSDQNDKYWKKDNDSAHLNFGSKRLVIGSKRGRSHAQEGKFRDDAFDFCYHDETGWGIIAVADGAGSAKYSRKGSEIACETIIEYFKDIDKEKLRELETSLDEVFTEPTEESQKKLSGYFIEHLGKAAFLAQLKIRDEAILKHVEIRDYSTTLIFALIKEYKNKFIIASFWVGDGGIGIYSKEKKEVMVLGVPDSGEFAGQTRFVTMSDIFANGAYANRVRFKIIEDFTAMILMTDGITDPKFQTDANLNRIEKWDELWADLEGINQDNYGINVTKPVEQVEMELMQWLDFWSPGNHDDRTIAILY